MAIQVHCTNCGKTMKGKDAFAGTRGLCPFCNSEVDVPNVPAKPAVSAEAEAQAETKIAAEKEFKLPTEKQLDYARTLGIRIPDGVSRRELSRLIDEALENAPATESQKEFLRELGVSFPDNIRSKQMSILLDTALNIRDQVQSAVQKNYDRQMKEAGFLMDSATELQLLQELRNRGKPFVIFTLDNDEFRYQEDLPISGKLQWSDDLNVADVQWVLINITSSWAKKLDLPKYSDEFDDKPPRVEFIPSELPTDAGNVVHLNVNLDFGGPKQ